MLGVLLAAASAVAPAPEHRYTVVGSDTYRVGSPATTAVIRYHGSERLSIVRSGDQTRYVVRARYRRTGDDGVADAHARFIQVASPKSGLRDVANEDPDFLTILNQPFAVQLDRPTLGDLRTLHGPVPFSATSPLGGDAVLRGFLRPAAGGKVDGVPTVAVGFEAVGVMTGPMPTHAATPMSGQMRMVGTAYYATGDALLLALRARLTIVAQLHDKGGDVPVRIVYRRFIRAAKTPRPTPLPSGGAAASPRVPSAA